MDPYLNSIHHNLSHLRSIIPAQPKRNLAANSKSLPLTEDDPVLANQMKWSAIPEGHPGTHRTLQIMAQMAREASRDPKFVKFARQFSGLSDLENWMRDHFTYRDERTEVLRTPVFMLEDMGRTTGTRIVGLEGDCDDSATFLGAAAKVLGFPARLVAIRHNPNVPDFEHVFAQAFDRDGWATLDPTVDIGTVINSIESMIVNV
jgi:transglutaminase-like putative cysteine protease